MPKITKGSAPAAIQPEQQTLTGDVLEEAGEPGFGFHSLEETEDKLNVLYYGREGSGKTSHALDMAHLGKVLVINVEGGLKKQALKKRGIPTERVMIWPAPGERVTFDAFIALHEQIRSDLDRDPDSWAGVVIDSGTELATIFRENATQARRDDLDRQGRSYDPNFIDRGDYGVQTDQAQRILRKFRDLPCHFVITALERVEDETGVAGPAMNPALASAVLGYVDFVLFAKATMSNAETTEEIETEFRAATRPGSKWRAKDRFDVTPRVLAEPTFTRLLGYVEGDLTEDADVLQEEFNERQTKREEEAAARKAAEEAAKAARKTRKTPTGTRSRTRAAKPKEAPSEAEDGE